MLPSSLNKLSNQGLIWQGDLKSSVMDEDNQEQSSTGFSNIDALLNTAGWPCGDVVEVLTPKPGIGELSLFTPWLKQASRKKKVAFINPPFIPNAKVLEQRGIDSKQLWLINTSNQKDTLWVQYQCLKSGLCCAVFMWHPAKVDTKSTRKLQLAARDSHTLGITIRPEVAANQSTLFPYRMHIKPNKDGLDVTFLKRRGGWETRPVFVPLNKSSSPSLEQVLDKPVALVAV